MNSTKVLIVEDDPRYLELLRFTAEAAGFQVVTSSDPRQVIDLAVREEPQVIISDILMPEIDGITLGLRLKSDKRTAGIPLIYLSALGSGMNRAEGLTAGAVEYLTKPFAPSDLIKTIRRVLCTAESKTESES